VQWEVGASHVTCETGQLSQSARTHGLGWRTAHASSIDEKVLYILKATSAPPRAGTTGIGYILLILYIIGCHDIPIGDIPVTLLKVAKTYGFSQGPALPPEQPACQHQWCQGGAPSTSAGRLWQLGDNDQFIWYSKMGVSINGVPQKSWKTHPEMDDIGVPPFLETSRWSMGRSSPCFSRN